MSHIWKWDWSPTKARAFIVDELGFLIAGPVFSAKQAKRLVAEHNRIVAQLTPTDDRDYDWRIG